MEEKKRRLFVKQSCEKFKNSRFRLLDILWEIQNGLGGIEGPVMEQVGKLIGVSRVHVEGLVTFYAFFSDRILGKIIIRLCDDIVDQFFGLDKIIEVFSEELGIKPGQTSLDGRFSFELTPSIGMSDQAPAALINDVVFPKLTPGSVKKIIRQLKEGVPVFKVDDTCGDGNNASALIHSSVMNNIRHTGKVILSDSFLPEKGLERCLNLNPAEVIKEMKDSGLRGGGGAGFPSGLKWELARKAEAEKRHVICNADEGELGTFKDRVLLTERAPMMVEGMTIAAYAIGSSEGIIYLRAEYAYLRPWLENILEKRRDTNLLGKDILGKTGFHFDIRIQLGAGAYICGEESALICSCEGLRGEPRIRPPFPVEKGYMGQPTIVNNVETFCCAARIFEKGFDWFSNIGTDKSAGTKLLSVSGDCKKTGIYELAYGTAVADLLEMAEAHDTAIVQIGGASGEMIGRIDFNRKICFEDLATSGSVMVFNSQRNVLKIVDSFLKFFIDESCGYCTPCRVGNVFLRERIQKVMHGDANHSDLDYLRQLSNLIIKTSRCGLGNASPKPVLSSLEHFPIVYASHLHEPREGLQRQFNIQKALEESRRIAKRRSMIYDPVYYDTN
ncbi:MAG: NADH:ubiquinone oxidoreductase [Desulfobacteraceae bacterium]|nr:NADH:ubiquinone oxidoreductase [Desulfobacteraceae bacterium]